MALGLARAGANVVITAVRGRREIQAVADEARAAKSGVVRALTADVTSEEDCRSVMGEAIREFGAIHILVNNAGRGMRFVSEGFLETPTKFWQTDPAVWRMIRQRWGRIVNISMNYETMRRAGFSPYGPSKAALESETVIWAQDVAGTGVTVNSLLPGGATDTGMIPGDVAPQIRKRLLRAEVVVPPLLWLASDLSGDVTGARFVASLWDSSLPPAEAAQAACSTEGAIVPAS